MSSKLTMGADGYWMTHDVAAVSYPDDCHDLCLGVEEGSFWFGHRNEVIAATMRRLPPPGTTFDVGGGNGYVAKRLADEGLPVVLVEPGPIGARNAVRRGVDHVVCSTLGECGFAEGSLPGVSLFDVLEHLEDDCAFLSEIRSLMAPGGRLYLTVPAFSALWSHEDSDVGHYRRYTLAELTERLEACGFQVEYSTYFFWPLPLPIWLIRSIPSRLGLRRKSEKLTQREHSVGSGFVRRLVDAVLAPELARIAGGGRVPIGGSCLAVARVAE